MFENYFKLQKIDKLSLSHSQPLYLSLTPILPETSNTRQTTSGRLSTTSINSVVVGAAVVVVVVSSPSASVVVGVVVPGVVVARRKSTFQSVE